MVTNTAEKILAAATTEICARGVDGARVDEIAHLAGVNKRMIYHHFGNKAGLCDAVVRRALSVSLQHPLLSEGARGVLGQVADAAGLAAPPSGEVVATHSPSALQRAMTILMTEFARSSSEHPTAARVEMQAWLSFCLEAMSWMLADLTPRLFGRRFDDGTVRNMSETVAEQLAGWNGGRRKVRLPSATRRVEG